MRGIKHVLTERQYAWEDALKLAENDPEVNLSGDGNPVYTPLEYLEEAEELVDEQIETTKAGNQAQDEPAETSLDAKGKQGTPKL